VTHAVYAKLTATDAAASDRIAVILKTPTDSMRVESGNLVFDAYRREGKPLEFFVYEVCAHEVAPVAHIRQDHGRFFNAELEGLIEGEGSTLTFLTTI
jgi:quinol monooxygenase YgiN